MNAVAKDANTAVVKNTVRRLFLSTMCWHRFGIKEMYFN